MLGKGIPGVFTWRNNRYKYKCISLGISVTCIDTALTEDISNAFVPGKTDDNFLHQFGHYALALWNMIFSRLWVAMRLGTVYPKKYAHGFVVLCFVVVMQSFIMNSHEVFIHIHQGCFAGTGAIVRLPQCQWSKLDGYGKISQCITTTKHSKAKTVCIFLGIYCRWRFTACGGYRSTRGKVSCKVTKNICLFFTWNLNEILT